MPFGPLENANTTAAAGNGIGYNSVASLTGGGYVVSWWTNSAIRARVYDASGAAIGPDIAAATTDTFAELSQHSAVTGLDGGGFLVAWRARCLAPFPSIYSCAYGQRYSASGSPVGGLIGIDDRTVGTGSSDGPMVASLGNGGFVAVWKNEGSTSLYRRFDADGAPLSAEAPIPGVPGLLSPRVARLSSGGAVIVDGTTGSGNAGHVYALRLNSDGTPNGTAFRASVCCDPQAANPGKDGHTVVGTSDGGFVVAWSVENDIVGRRFDAGGGATTDELPLTLFTDGSQHSPNLAALPSGGFVVVRTDTTAPSHPAGLYGLRFSSANAPAGPEFLVVAGAGNTLPFAIASLPSGRFVTTWATRAVNGDGVVQTQRWSSAGAPYAAADTAATTSATPVTISALANDADPDLGDTLTITGASAVSGTLVVNGGTTLTYTPPADCSILADTITYTIRDSTNNTATGTVAVIITPTPALGVSPAAPYAPSGPAGGPFTPASRSYTVTNTCGADLSWTAATGQPWLAVSPTSGVLGPGGSVTAMVALQASAANLAVGTYSDTISFTNISNGRGTTSRQATLGVYGPTIITAALLPSARSVQVGTPATAFGTIINSGASSASACALAKPASPEVSATFSYQTTNGLNQLIGAPNTPVDIPAGASQSFVLALTPTAPFEAQNLPIVFDCSNTAPAAVLAGVNTLLLSASAVPSPDMVAIGATPGGDGIVHIPGSGSGFFGAAAINIGASGTLTATADTGGVSLPVSIYLCQTNTAGACINPPTLGTSSTTTIGAQGVVTYTVVVVASAPIPLDPAVNRVTLKLATSDGTVRGATSVAVRKEP